MHIQNLYKDQRILGLRECYAMEKVHGSSAHVEIESGVTGIHVSYFPGGESLMNFMKIFNEEDLKAKFKDILEFGGAKVTIYGEVYGPVQKMSHIYGPKLGFIVFDVFVHNGIDGVYLAVPQAEDVAKKLGLEFVPYMQVSCTTDCLNAERSKPSEVAKRRGMGDDKPREGIVVRPLFELRLNNGERLMVKHKNEDYSERTSKRDTKVIDPAKLKALEDAKAVADEFVNPMRMSHVVAKLEAQLAHALDIKDTPLVIKAMIEDVNREGKGEFAASQDVDKAIGQAAAKLFKQTITTVKAV